MAGYLIVRINVKDPNAYEEYKKLAQEAVAKHGGRYLVRGGRTETLEGEKETARIVVLEFPSLDQVSKFYHSPEYQQAIAKRKNAATAQFVAAEGA
jgi:uncharacterized protein (DUF1330 family)